MLKVKYNNCQRRAIKRNPIHKLKYNMNGLLNVSTAKLNKLRYVNKVNTEAKLEVLIKPLNV